MSSLMLDDAAAYAYGSPASLLSTPQLEPLSQYAYDQWDASCLPPPLQSDFETRQHSSMSVDPWAARGTLPIQSAYSTIADAPGCCPTDVYAPASQSVSNMVSSPPSYYPALAPSLSVSSRDALMAPGTIPVHSTIADALTCCPANVYAPTSPPGTATTVFGGRQAESTPQSRRRGSRPLHQQPTYSSSYPSPTPSSSASSSYPSSTPSSSASSSYSSPSPSSSASSPFASSSYPSPSPSSSSSSRDSSKPDVIFTPRRNTAVSPNARRVVSKNPLKCSFCSYVAPKGRLPDLARHVNTHMRSNNDESFKCCGVPLAEAKELGVPTERMKERPLVYQEIKMVGGCRKAFSRRDALLRHLRDNKGVCFGDAHAPYLLGNQ